MPLYVPCIEQWQGKDEKGCASMLLMSPGLEIAHSSELKMIETDFDGGPLLDYFELENQSTKEIPYVLLPSGNPILMFFLCSQQTDNYLCGPLTSARRIVIPPKSTVFCVRLKVGGMKWFAQTPVFPYADKAVPMSGFLADVIRIQKCLRSTNTFQQRCSVLFDDLENSGSKLFHVDPLTKHCVDSICEQRGFGRVNELGLTVNRSERYLGKVFRETTGISIKKYFEIIKFKNSLHSLIVTRPRVLSDVVQTHGYYDLAHMNRAYRMFLGYTASEVAHINIDELYVPDLF